jgi:hypothetical protein
MGNIKLILALVATVALTAPAFARHLHHAPASRAG